ncbi:AzlC family ABC transporter permease [Phreatobacter stygius]|uniref:AzlC family ABC transporter permease n=2 Tax=Phreatobacter stygius TaxID=1940610 RepID=A0A4D7BH93_9HYPH|nr:AzlC family ABC transporter permease [Phreatobacter stygius]
MPAAPLSTPLSEFRDGIADLWPAMVAAAPIGLLYGAIATTKGLSPIEVALSSALIFAGGAQLAAIELWTVPVPVAALVVSTLLINARYLLMSASLAPKVARLPLIGRLFGFHVLADENWALAERRAARQPITAAYFFGMGAAFWVNWVAWSYAGTILGPLLGDPRRFGADFAFTAIFIGLIVGFVTGPRTGLVVVVSALAATGAFVAFGSPWHVLVGALAGMAAAVLAYRDDAAPKGETA